MTYSVRTHLGEIYNGDDLDIANSYADSVIEVESCFGYVNWPVYEFNSDLFKHILREQVCEEDIYKFVSIVGGVTNGTL